jgi:dTDP-4-amino-4,6-dideoxygalactose transaminase
LPFLHRGAKIVFSDVEDDLNQSITDIERKITPRTKAIVFVHFGGNNRGLREVVELAHAKGITLIEDAAQAVGSDYWGKGDFVCISFQAIKTLTTGDGGALICPSDELTQKAKRLRWFGIDRDLKHKQGDTDIVEAGYKYHMNDIAAAIGRGNLAVIDRIILHRKRLVNAYRQNGILNAHPWFAFVLTKRRAELMAYLKEHGIDADIHHYRNDKYAVFGGRQKLPKMDELEEQYLFLPVHQGVTIGDVGRICALVKTFEARKD